MVIEKMQVGKIVNGVVLNNIIDLVCRGQELRFENDTTKQMFNTLVRNWISEKMNGLHRMIFPQVGMDCNGEWTTDKSKWV